MGSDPIDDAHDFWNEDDDITEEEYTRILAIVSFMQITRVEVFDHRLGTTITWTEEPADMEFLIPSIEEWINKRQRSVLEQIQSWDRDREYPTPDHVQEMRFGNDEI